MPTTGGPAKWEGQGGSPNLGFGFALDGQFFKGGRAYPQLTIEQTGGGTAIIPTASRDVLQHVILGGDVPEDLLPMEMQCQFFVNHQEDYDAFLFARAQRRAAGLFLGMYVIESWRLDLGSGDGIFKPMRQFPFDLPGVTHATAGTRAWRDGTPLDIVTAGSPGTGEALVPETGGYQSIEVDPEVAGDRIILSYMPVFRVLLMEVSQSLEAYNGLAFSATMLETRGRSDYTAFQDNL